jgi:hypothetical protein
VSRRAESIKIYVEGENMQVLKKPKIQSLITEMEQILTLRDSQKLPSNVFEVQRIDTEAFNLLIQDSV